MGCFESKNEETTESFTVSQGVVHNSMTPKSEKNLNKKSKKYKENKGKGTREKVTEDGQMNSSYNRTENERSTVEAGQIAPWTNPEISVQGVKPTGMLQTAAGTCIEEHPNNHLQSTTTKSKKKSNDKPKKNKEKGKTNKVTEDRRIDSSCNRNENKQSVGNTVEYIMPGQIAARTNPGVQDVKPTGMIQTAASTCIEEHPNKQLPRDEKAKTASQSGTNKSNTNDMKDKAMGKPNEDRKRVDTPEKRNSEHETKLARGYAEDTKTKTQDQACPPERITLKEKQELREKNESVESEREKFKKDLKEADDKLQKLKTRSKKREEELENKIKELEEEVAEVTARADKNMKEMEKDVKNKTSKIQRLEYERNVMKSEKEEIIKNQDRALIGKTKKIQSLEKEKDELLLRLSAMAGRRLTDNNPDITDLSDTNRPTKLAERYSELYDNEWTDAFSYLQKLDAYKNSEQEVISTLLEMIKIAYEVSFSTAEKQLGDLSRILSDFSESSERDVNISDILKQMKDYRKKAVKPNKNMAKDYRQKVERALPKLPASSFKSGALKDYLDKCLQLSWYMVIQDPPVHLGSEVCKRGDTFDKNQYKEYTESGFFVSYAVWPALFLKKDGPLLCKGVVQCSKQRLSGSFRSIEPQIKDKGRESKTKSLYNPKELTSDTKLCLDKAAIEKEVNKEENKIDKKDHAKSTKF